MSGRIRLTESTAASGGIGCASLLLTLWACLASALSRLSGRPSDGDVASKRNDIPIQIRLIANASATRAATLSRRDTSG